MSRVSVLFVCLLCAAAPTPAGDSGWERVAEHDGVRVEVRDVEGSALHEVRATAHSSLPPDAILATLWKHDELEQFVPYLKHLEILRDEGDTRTIYEQITAPLLKDRDVTLRVTRHVDPATGVCEVTAVSTADDGPPPRPDHVRVRTNASRWRLVPAPGGGTDLTYTIRTDVGGFVPAWIVNIAQKDATSKLVRAMLERADENTRAAAR